MKSPRYQSRRFVPGGDHVQHAELVGAVPSEDALREVPEHTVLDRDVVEAARIVDAVTSCEVRPDREPLQVIVIPDTDDHPRPGAVEVWVSTALVASVCPQDVIGVPPPPVASGATTTTSTSATTPAKLAGSLIRLPPSPLLRPTGRWPQDTTDAVPHTLTQPPAPAGGPLTAQGHPRRSSDGRSRAAGSAACHSTKASRSRPGRLPGAWAPLTIRSAVARSAARGGRPAVNRGVRTSRFRARNAGRPRSRRSSGDAFGHGGEGD